MTIPNDINNNNVTVPNNLVLNGRYTFDFKDPTQKSVYGTVLSIDIILKDVKEVSTNEEQKGQIAYPINFIKNATPINNGGRKKSKKSKKTKKSRRR